MCYRTGKYTVRRRVRASFSPEILQAVAVKGFKLSLLYENDMYICFNKENLKCSILP